MEGYYNAWFNLLKPVLSQYSNSNSWGLFLIQKQDQRWTNNCIKQQDPFSINFIFIFPFIRKGRLQNYSWYFLFDTPFLFPYPIPSKVNIHPYIDIHNIPSILLSYNNCRWLLRSVSILLELLEAIEKMLKRRLISHCFVWKLKRHIFIRHWRIHLSMKDFLQSQP